MDQVAIAMKGYSKFLKSPRLSYPVHSLLLLGGGAYPSAMIHSVYSAVPADWAVVFKGIVCKTLYFLINQCAP